MTKHRFSKPRRLVVSAVTLVAAGGTVGVGTLSAVASTPSRPHDGVQQRLDTIVKEDTFPAALAAVREKGGHTRNYTAGVGNLKTGAKVPEDGQVRIGSNTKTFTAVLVLQLVGEGKVELDAPIETYLPGLVRGEGIDGRHITVRQLLQHTSGLPNYTEFIESKDYVQTYYQPRAMLDTAFSHKAEFPPGTKWQYSNTNYIVAGLLVEKVTGRPLIEEMNKRIIQRIGLRHTYFPNVGDRTIHERHPHGYSRDENGAIAGDITVMDPSMGWAAGQMVATPSDVNRFFTALLDGKLIKPAELKQMRNTVDAPELGNGVKYGLGLTSTPLSCGGLAWGHGGDIDGYHTVNAATDDGRAATVAATALPTGMEQVEHTTAIVDEALCK
jgi:D-alanyl-D-alanine carboxypeptidase